MDQKHDTTKTIPTQKTQIQNLPQKTLHNNLGNIVQRMKNDQSSLQYDDIMQLQKMIGNNAVSHLLSGKQEQSFAPRSLSSFLQRNTPQAGIIQGVFKSESEIRKEQFIKEAKEKGITDPEQIDKLYAEARKDVPEEDPLTKFELAADRKPTVKRAIEYMGTSTESAFYVEADVRNLGGLGDKLGRSAASEILKQAAQITQKQIKKLGGFLGSFHHGGDEFSFVVVGEVKLKDLENALKAAEHEYDGINKTTAKDASDASKEWTIRDVPHLKHPSQSGTAIAWGLSLITSESKVSEVLATADQLVELKKSTTPLYENKQQSDDTSDENADQSSLQNSQSQQPSKSSKKMSSKDKKETRNFYKRMIKSYSLQPQDVGKGAILTAAYENYSSFGDGTDNARVYIYEQIKAIGTLKYALRRKKGDMQSEEQMKEAAFIDFAKQQGLEDQDIAKALFHSAREDIMDPVTGFEPQSSAKGTVDAAITHLGKMSEHHGVFVMAKLKNLAGLNHFLGTSGTDKIFAKIADETDSRLRNEISQDELHISHFREAGGKFSFVIVGRVLTEGLVNAVLQKAAKAISRYNNRSIKAYNKTSEVAGGKIGETVVNPTNDKQKGTGLAYGVSAINSDGSSAKITSAAQQIMKIKDV